MKSDFEPMTVHEVYIRLGYSAVLVMHELSKVNTIPVKYHGSIMLSAC